MLIFWPKYTIILLCPVFELVKKFYFSDSPYYDFMTDSFFSNLLLQLQLYLAISVLP